MTSIVAVAGGFGGTTSRLVASDGYGRAAATRGLIEPNALLTSRLPARSGEAMFRVDRLAVIAVIVIVVHASMRGRVRRPICVVGPARRHRWALLLLGDRRRIVAGGGIGLCAGSFLKKG